MKRGLIIFILILLINVNLIYAVCSEGQIDINSASAEELEKLYGIGPVKAQAIIDERPFKTLDDLLEAWGIGEATLEKIKKEGFACVSENYDDDEDEDNNEDDMEEDNGEKQENHFEHVGGEIEEKNVIEVIKLSNPKNIKSEDDIEDSRSNYAIYGFVAFCVLLCFLFILKRRKYKNEFE